MQSLSSSVKGLFQSISDTVLLLETKHIEDEYLKSKQKCKTLRCLSYITYILKIVKGVNKIVLQCFFFFFLHMNYPNLIDLKSKKRY